MNNVARAQAVQKAAKKKFRGHTVLKSKGATQFPENLAREYIKTAGFMCVPDKISVLMELNTWAKYSCDSFVRRSKHEADC